MRNLTRPNFPSLKNEGSVEEAESDVLFDSPSELSLIEE